MMIGHRWMIGALAAALWMAPAAAQTGSTSQGYERAYPAGNGTDPTRNNTDPDEAPSSSRGNQGARERGNEADEGRMGTGSSDVNVPSTTPEGAPIESGDSAPGGRNPTGPSANYPYSR